MKTLITLSAFVSLALFLSHHGSPRPVVRFTLIGQCDLETHTNLSCAATCVAQELGNR